MRRIECSEALCGIASISFVVLSYMLLESLIIIPNMPWQSELLRNSGIRYSLLEFAAAARSMFLATLRKKAVASS